MLISRLLIALALVIPLVACPDDNREDTPEYELAVIQTGDADLDPGAAIVDDLEEGLDSLQPRCRESREQLAGQVSDAHEELADNEVERTPLEIIQEVADALDKDPDQSCAQVLDAYVLLRTGGREGGG
jgi:hypothetical protein